MKKAITMLIALSAMIVLAHFASAAPGPWGIAINAQTRECAGFWPGDEHVAYSLPKGWKSYPETNATSLKTDLGECDFVVREERKCCEQLGLTYVSDNIGKVNKKKNGVRALLSLAGEKDPHPQEDQTQAEQVQQNTMLLAEINFKKGASSLSVDDIPDILLHSDYDSVQILLRVRDIEHSDANPVSDEWRLGIVYLAKTYSRKALIQAFEFIENHIAKGSSQEVAKQTFYREMKHTLITRSGSYSGFVALDALCKTTPEEKESLQKIIEDLHAAGYAKALNIQQFHPDYLSFLKRPGEIQVFIALQSHPNYRHWERHLLDNNTFPVFYTQPPSASLAQLEQWAQNKEETQKKGN